MQLRTLLTLAAGVVVLAAAAVILIASQLTPQATNPAFTTAVDFVNAAGKGDDAVALALLNNAMETYVAAHCPNGSPSACVQSYTPPEWGEPAERDLSPLRP